MSGLHRNAQRVQRVLRDAGSPASVHELPVSARTAQEAATGLGVRVGAIAKSLVFVADGEPLLVIASGRHRVDVDKVRRAVQARTVDRADAHAVRDATGFPIGGVAPVGHPAPLRTLVDRALAAYPVVWAAAGTPRTVFPTTYDELLRLTGATPADVGAEPAEPAEPGG